MESIDGITTSLRTSRGMTKGVKVGNCVGPETLSNTIIESMTPTKIRQSETEMMVTVWVSERESASSVRRSKTVFQGIVISTIKNT
jgi:hypothetical protein